MGDRAGEDGFWSFSQRNAVVAFSGRMGGSSTGPFAEANISLRVGDDPDSVRSNRLLLMHRLGIAGSKLVTVQQRHTATVIDVDGDSLPSPTSETIDLAVTADGMVTREPGIALLVGIADCAPVALLDAEHGVVGVLHVGWRGLLAGIVPAGIAAMLGSGASAPHIRALIGPTIGPCCYPVGDDVRSAVVSRYPHAAAMSREQRPALDLRLGIREALGEAGVDDVVPLGGCTSDSPDLCFSQRRDGVTGCQAGLVVLTAD